MDGWDQYYECVDRELGRQMERHLHLFRESLEWWLYAELNWPSRDWETQLQYLVDHTRYYGLEIHPVSIQSLHNLVEARVNGTGPFEALGPYRWDEPAVATGEPIQLALTVGLDDGTRTDAEPAMNTEIKAGETEFDRKLTEAQGHLDEIEPILESLAGKLDLAKFEERVEVEAEINAIEKLIWRYNDLLESARDTWLRNSLSGEAYRRLSKMGTPAGFGLPFYTDQQQAERAKRQELLISRRLRQRTVTLDRVIIGMRAMEYAGVASSIGLGIGVVWTAFKEGGKWAVVKTVAKVAASGAAAYGAGKAVEHGLRAAGASEETIHGVQLAAEIVTWLLLLRRIQSAGGKPSAPTTQPPARPKQSATSSPKPVESNAPRAPYNNPSGNPKEAARAGRTQRVGARPEPRATGKPNASASLGSASTTDYRATFFKAHPELKGKVIVHHAIPQKALIQYPNVITKTEVHSLENLRGIPKSANPELHLGRIAKEWNEFYRSHATATKEQLLQKATELDLKYGALFSPPTRG